MSEEEIFEKLREVLCGFLDVSEEEITPDSSLKDDLDLDPQYDEDIYDEIIMDFFDIESELTAEDFEDAETVQDLVDEIGRRIND